MAEYVYCCDVVDGCFLGDLNEPDRIYTPGCGVLLNRAKYLKLKSKGWVVDSDWYKGPDRDPKQPMGPVYEELAPVYDATSDHLEVSLSHGTDALLAAPDPANVKPSPEQSTTARPDSQLVNCKPTVKKKPSRPKPKTPTHEHPVQGSA